MKTVSRMEKFNNLPKVTFQGTGEQARTHTSGEQRRGRTWLWAGSEVKNPML